MPCSAHSPLGLPVKILSRAVFKGHILPHLQALQALPCPLPVLPSSLFPPQPLCSRHKASSLLLQYIKHSPARGPLHRLPLLTTLLPDTKHLMGHASQRHS